MHTPSPDKVGLPPASASPLFQPGRIGSVVVKNRVVMAPMTTRCADADGFVTEELIDYYARRAAGGVGLITIEMSSPELVGRHRRFELGIHDDKFIPGLRTLVDALHGFGAKVSIQLGHGGGHTRDDVAGEKPIAPSAIPYEVEEGNTETVIPEAMSRARIERTVRAFADAAVRAEKAGFDFIEIHAAHGYLISQFLAPAENHREDEYGGTLENRARFALEVTRAIRAATASLGIVFRLNGDDYFPGGLILEEAERLSVWAVEAGADSLSVTGGHYRSLPSAAVMIPPMNMPDGTFLHLAKAIKERVSVPVIAVGRLGDPPDAVRALADGYADFVALGRPLLADAEWANDVHSDTSVRMCIACNTCVDGMRAGGRLHCLINAEAGRELAFKKAGFPHSGPRNKRIAVIGAGPAGLSYASLVAGSNQVTVFERAGCGGGAFRMAGLAPKFQGVDANPASLLRFIASLEARCRQAGVTFKFNHDIQADDPVLDNFDLVVIAVGAKYPKVLGRVIDWALRNKIAHLPPLRGIVSSAPFRNWFYYKARRPAGRRLVQQLEGRIPVLVLGDAKRPGKSQEAIITAFESAAGCDKIPAGRDPAEHNPLLSEPLVELP